VVVEEGGLTVVEVTVVLVDVVVVAGSDVVVVAGRDVVVVVWLLVVPVDARLPHPESIVAARMPDTTNAIAETGRVDHRRAHDRSSLSDMGPIVSHYRPTKVSH
jgi:hypothetical protein